jgi:hypothetical protein
MVLNFKSKRILREHIYCEHFWLITNEIRI